MSPLPKLSWYLGLTYIHLDAKVDATLLFPYIVEPASLLEAVPMVKLAKTIFLWLCCVSLDAVKTTSHLTLYV
jgi:hypothetical protein